MSKKQQKQLEQQRVRLQEERSRAAPAVPSFAAQAEVPGQRVASTGLLTVEEFRAKREAERKAEQQQKQRAEQQQQQQSRRVKLASKAKLSFRDDEEEEQQQQQHDQHDQQTAAKRQRSDPELLEPAIRITKDPTVDTAFLPDKAREEEERQLRERLEREWESEQARMREEPMVVTYSFWDGRGHRRVQKVKRGNTIGEFLSLARDAVDELQGVSTANLLFVKEDTIIPHHYSFHELIAAKARAKNGGPLFTFDVYDDVRLLHDATVDKDESHAAKVCERRWYDQNRHIFPASRWTVYEEK